jgi:putative pyruvate formate lyase activating enzyme
MTAGASIERTGRSPLAVLRAAEARGALAQCDLCAHQCGVDRRFHGAGRCHAGPVARVFSAQVDLAEELELIPCFAIALGGCDLRCAFCVSGAESWNPRAGDVLDSAHLAARAGTALANGARSIMILGGEPTVHLPAALEIAAAMPEEARLVWKTNGHASARARALLEGIFDVWLVDYKFGNDACAARLAGVDRYSEILRGNLVWAAHQGGLIVRHLLMPGHVECCWRPVATWLAEELPGVKVSLRASFWPGWQAARHAGLNRFITADETNHASAIARELGLNLVE